MGAIAIETPIWCDSAAAPGLKPVATDTLKHDVRCANFFLDLYWDGHAQRTHHTFTVATGPQIAAILAQDTEVVVLPCRLWLTFLHRMVSCLWDSLFTVCLDLDSVRDHSADGNTACRTTLRVFCGGPCTNHCSLPHSPLSLEDSVRKRPIKM